ncbi:MAG TPA: 2-iminoacetate synthase ThiH, partial [Verrucomicrobiae bacterium]|nr:2-iminoacetate synthase ThiH [Verrucomicrobiae bacterium]
MSFVSEFNALPLKSLLSQAREADWSADSLSASVAGQPMSLSDFAGLLSPAAGEQLEELCRQSQGITQQRFGKVIRLFAPLYLSNECINNCEYCGFSRDNPILRVTLSTDEVLCEARALKDQGFRSLLLVAGEHPKFVSNSYLADCIRALRPEIPAIALEVGPMETEDY